MSTTAINLNTSVALAVFTKSPVLGATKTRLIPLLAEQGALNAHISLVERALTQIRGVTGMDTSLWSTARDSVSDAWAQSIGAQLYVQQGNELGVRMLYVFETLLAQGYERVLLMGSDCPGITSEYINAAATALKNSDIVIAPAQDGGYGLIGMKAPQPEVFTDVPWSSNAVFTTTLKRCAVNNLSVHTCPEIWDVDTPADWQRYLAEFG